MAGSKRQGRVVVIFEDAKKFSIHNVLMSFVLGVMLAFSVFGMFIFASTRADPDISLRIISTIFSLESDKYSTHPYVRNLTISIIGNSTSDYAKAHKISRWLGDNLRYVSDPHNTNIFIDVVATLKQGYGDCEEVYGYVPLAMLKSVGVDGCIVIEEMGNGDYHAYAIAFTERGKFRMDYGIIYNKSSCAG